MIIMSAACQNWLLNGICVRCQIGDNQTRQHSACEVRLNFVPERGNGRLYASGKPGIREPCLRIQHINSISLRLSFYTWMIRYSELDQSWEGREVDSESLVQLTENQSIWLILEYPEFFRDSSIQCA
jgi:hypothetical protein